MSLRLRSLPGSTIVRRPRYLTPTSVPTFTVVIRKGYGLGALGMAGGSFHASVFTIAWPTGEFGGMGLEGQVKLGKREELMALPSRTSASTRSAQA